MPTYAFGPFHLDEGARYLTRDQEPVALPDRQLVILLTLVSQPGQTLSKDTLIERAWQDVAVSDNSLEQAISALRRVLGPAPDGAPYIETVPRRGYRFRTAVTRAVARHTDSALESMVAPYLAFVEGRAALETLEREAVDHARQVMTDVVTAAPDYAPGQIGLANALALAFEATRVDETPDLAALQAAGHHAREACRLDAGSGEAWATLAFVLSRAGANTDAVAAGRRALALEPDNWRHAIRLAYASWGEERLRAAHRVLELLPGVGLAHWLAGTVYVARQAFDEAERELTAGTQAQDHQPDDAKFGAVGLHLLSGMVRLARGNVPGAVTAFKRELAFEETGHVYTRMACANAWCALGAIRLRQDETPNAVAAFAHALETVPGYPWALAALAVLSDEDRHRSHLATRLAGLERHGTTVEVAMIRAVEEVWRGRHTEAAQRVQLALRGAPPGSSAGWTLPIEPLLEATAHTDAWDAVFATMRSRAA